MLIAIFCLTFVIVSLLAFLIYQNTKSKPSGPQPEGLAAQAQAADKQQQETQARLAGVETALHEAKTECAGMSARYEAAKQTCDETQRRHDLLAQTHQRVLEEHQAKMQGVETMLGAARASLAGVEANYTNAQRACEEAQARANVLTAQQDELREQHQTVLRHSSAAQAQADGLGKQVQAHEATLERVNKLLADKISTLENTSRSLGVAQEQYRHHQEQCHQLQAELEQVRTQLHVKTNQLLEANARLQMEEQAAASFEAIGGRLLRDTLEQAKTRIEDMTQSLTQTSSQELQKHAAQVAESLKPLQDQLHQYDLAIEGFKTSSHDLFGQVKQQMSGLQETEKALHIQAQSLTNALSAGPKVRGNYGEMVLKRIAEHAGMLDRCHFDEQEAEQTAEGRRIPDMIFKLPGNQEVVVDAKAVMNACQLAQEATSHEERTIHLTQHCKNVKGRVDDLHSKKYASNRGNRIEAVVLFLPAEHLYATAMENDPELTDYAMKKGIIICGPNTLMILLKTANHLWKQASIEEEAQKVAKLGAEMYHTTCNFLTNYMRFGEKIKQLTDAYNTAGGTLDGTLILKGRELGKMKSIGAQEEIADFSRVEAVVRSYRSVESKAAENSELAMSAE